MPFTMVLLYNFLVQNKRGLCNIVQKIEVTDILNTKNFNRGVRVNIGERETIVDVYITIEYGIKIVEVSEKVQEEVKEAIENMTDFDVVEVNVHISGIAVKNSEKTVVK